MNKQILIILLLIILILSLSVSASEMPENPEDYLELAKKIYSGSMAEMIVAFEKEFTPKKIIVDDIILGDSLDGFRVDVLFIGL